MNDMHHAAAPTVDWPALNHRWLTRALEALRLRIEAALPHAEPLVHQVAEDDMPGFTSALDRCAALFGLSPFERELLLLTAGVELDRALRRTVEQAQARLAEREELAEPTFALALRILPQAHWDALSPQAPLRRWHLVDLDGRHSPARQPLRIDERVLHYLTGTPAADGRLFGIARVERLPAFAPLSTPAQRIAHALDSHGAGNGAQLLPLLLLEQERDDPGALREAVLQGLAATGATGATALWLHACDLPRDPRLLAETARYIDRESVLTGSVPVIETEAENDDHVALSLVAQLHSPVLLAGAHDPLRLARLPARRVARIPVPAPDVAQLRERAAQWLEERSTPDHASALLSGLHDTLQHFSLSYATLQGVIEDCLAVDDQQIAAHAWQAGRAATRGGLDTLARRIDSEVRFSDLVLPAAHLRMLEDIAGNLRHRHTVYEQWGMAGPNARGHGLCALFAGESGTGKTLAAEAIANAVQLDLYRIDLATVVSKYIGETEKNLKRLFDAAEASGAVLLFDEADALFGKRSDVKDSHDRYANIEVAYLLQRIEAYRGLAILTTNQKSAIDRAFLRRIRFLINFPFPDLAARRALWSKAFAPAAPVSGLDLERLAGMPLSGGAIRNVALHAAFVAAARGTPIDAAAVAEGTRLEAAKRDRPAADLRWEASV